MKIRKIQPQDFTTVAKIEKKVWGVEGASFDQIKSRWQTFPQGSIVAELEDGKLVGYAVAQRVNHLSTGSWAEQTENGMITRTHKPEGQIAYGVNMSVLQEAAAMKISKAIIDHYHRIFIREGDCSILALGSRLPGLEKWQTRHSGTVRVYLQQLSGAYSIDPELRLYQKNGFFALWEIAGYFPDEGSGDFGVMIVRNWDG